MVDAINRQIGAASGLYGKALPYLWAAFVTLLIAGPWLLPGFLFGTDWPGPRRFSVPDQLSSATLFELALAGAASFLGAEAVTKLVILGMLFVSGVTAYKGLPTGGFIPRASAAILYTINPFVYGRIHYGQLELVAAYALLPLLASSLRQLAVEPKLQPAITVALSLTAIGILDLHVLVPAGLLAVTVAIVFAARGWSTPKYIARLAGWGLAAAGGAVLASSYWVIPLLRGTNPQGQQLAGFGVADLNVFKTVPDASLGLLPNVVGLYGFWAENVNRFPSMKDFAPFWPAVLGAMLALGLLGVAVALSGQRSVAFPGARPWLIALLGAGAIALLLDMGAAEPHLRPLVSWLDGKFPLYRGMRDAGKWTTLIALVYSQTIPLGSVAILNWLRARPRSSRVLAVQLVAAGALLALPLYYGNGLLFGMHGEVRPSAYPAGWYSADRMLLSDPKPGKTLFLPWHLYLRFGFIRNTNAVIATPAPSFFSVPIIVSADPEVSGLRPSNTPQQALLARLISAHGDADWPQALATLDIKYVLLAREVDWRSYQYLDHQDGLMRVAEYGSIVLYRNLSWRGP